MLLDWLVDYVPFEGLWRPTTNVFDCKYWTILTSTVGGNRLVSSAVQSKKCGLRICHWGKRLRMARCDLSIASSANSWMKKQETCFKLFQYSLLDLCEHRSRLGRQFGKLQLSPSSAENHGTTCWDRLFHPGASQHSWSRCSQGSPGQPDLTNCILRPWNAVNFKIPSLITPISPTHHCRPGHIFIHLCPNQPIRPARLANWMLPQSSRGAGEA